MKYLLHFHHLHIAHFKVPTELYMCRGEVAVPSVAARHYFLSEPPSLNSSQGAPQMSPPPWSFSFLTIIIIITTAGVNPLLCAPSTFCLFLCGELHTESSHFLETALKCPWVPLWIRLFLFSLQWWDWGGGTCNKNRFRSSCMLHSPLPLWWGRYFPFPWMKVVYRFKNTLRTGICRECTSGGEGEDAGSLSLLLKNPESIRDKGQFPQQPPAPALCSRERPGAPYLL